ncbi:MAG: DNA primase [Vulcanibacillus sp.]
MSSNFIPDEIIDSIRHHYDITDFIGQYVQLKKSGHNYFGLCPFHSEKTPSFSVSPDKQIYYCFGCGSGGDVIRFVMNIEGLDFVEAVSYLAKDSGLDIPQIDNFTAPEIKDQQRVSILEAYSLASKFYHYLLLETEQGQPALQYLSKRGFNREHIETFNLGYSPSSSDTVANFLLKRGFNLEVLKEAGLVAQTDDGRNYDHFRNRIIFPIADIQGKVIAFGGRVLDDRHPKYLNSQETKIFNKSGVLYNLHLAKKEIRKNGRVILFEGYVDTIAAWKAGVNYGVASLGTSLTEQQANILRRYANEILICYDSDTAGQQATLRAIEILSKTGCKIKVVLLPQGYDPDDYLSEYGADSFQKDIIDQAVSVTNFKLTHIRKEFNLKDDTKRLDYLRKALEIISDLKHEVERDHYLKLLSEEFQISINSLKSDFNQICKEKTNKKALTRDKLSTEWNNIIKNGNDFGKDNSLLPAYYNSEKILIYLMMKSSEITEKVSNEIGSEFHVEDFAVLAAYLYSYYGKGNIPEINRFISSIDDDKYRQIATKIAMLEINEDVSQNELDDYIMQVKNHDIDIQVKSKREEQIKAERSNNIAKSVELGLEIINLRILRKKGRS